MTQPEIPRRTNLAEMTDYFGRARRLGVTVAARIDFFGLPMEFRMEGGTHYEQPDAHEVDVRVYKVIDGEAFTDSPLYAYTDSPTGATEGDLLVRALHNAHPTTANWPSSPEFDNGTPVEDGLQDEFGDFAEDTDNADYPAWRSNTYWGDAAGHDLRIEVGAYRFHDVIGLHAAGEYQDEVPPDCDRRFERQIAITRSEFDEDDPVAEVAELVLNKAGRALRYPSTAYLHQYRCYDCRQL